ncbi:hemerythrin domain-containing protein [Streptomyces sp. TLI_146]|uniref:hemerythrin domain-containing protein n=1 Tax=Streptomyces sp. TLI_146 TaxID=1938858 RepID=UPI000CB27428|nr:hemerythrin domain-containing protein [Streptomyces sp. TLI_146]PKV83442.1 hemerythrin-like domain-containing protein [Streptomyces sp. TLI_146]
MNDRLDMTVMHAMHDALRRELRHIARITARYDPDPRHVLRGAAGWEMFRRALRAHHRAEDDALWPALRRALDGRPYDLTRLEAIEVEHAVLARLVATVDEALADPGTDPVLLSELAHSLITGLAGHLAHEEDAVFPLVQAVVDEQEWEHFGCVHAQRIAPHAAQLLPWLLEGADEHTTTVVLAQLPTHVRRAYTYQWQPEYALLDRWRIQVPSSRYPLPTAASTAMDAQPVKELT